MPPLFEEEEERPPVGAGPSGIFQEGHGTPAEPYKISSASDLRALADNISNGILDEPYYYELSSDIAIDDDSWTPIGNGTRIDGNLSEDSMPFIGVFDGNNHIISGLDISTDDDESGIGLFSAISGEDTVVQNLIIEGTVSAENSKTAGLIAGIVADGASIINCQAGSSEAESSITAMYCGGLVGYLMGSGSIEQSRNYATVSNPEGSGTNLGGIVGTVNHASDPANPLSITECYNYGELL